MRRPIPRPDRIANNGDPVTLLAGPQAHPLRDSPRRIARKCHFWRPCEKPLRFALLATLAACLPVPQALAWQQESDDLGVPLHWDQPRLRWRLTAPVPGWPDGGQAALARAAATWAAPACTDLVLRPAQPVEFAEIEVQGRRQPWAHAAEDAAWTDRDVVHGTGLVRGARIALNPAYDFTIDAARLPGTATPVDLEALLLHELGHALGLGHAQGRDAVMYAGVKPGAAPKRRLALDDVAAVCALYPVLRLPMPEAAAPPRQTDSLPEVAEACARWPWVAAAMAAALAGLGLAIRREMRRRRHQSGM